MIGAELVADDEQDVGGHDAVSRASAGGIGPVEPVEHEVEYQTEFIAVFIVTAW